MMKMMKMKLVLVLFCVLCVSAGYQHEDLRINGCSESDGEYVKTIDGEELWYADFSQEKLIFPQPDFMDPISYPGGYQTAVNQQVICKVNLQTRRNAMKEIPLEEDVPSTVVLYPRNDVDLDQSNVLLCYVSGFYPAPVSVAWSKNGVAVGGGLLNIPYLNKDGSFRQTARLDFTPQQGDIYSCSVSHRSLNAPLTRFWEVQTTQQGVGPSVFCGLGLFFGFVGVAAGTFFLVKGIEYRLSGAGDDVIAVD